MERGDNLNTYENISNELKAFFSNHPVFKIILPLDMAFVFGGVGILVLHLFLNVGMLYAIAYYAFFIGIILAYANMHEKYLYLGLFIYAGASAWLVLANALFNKYVRYLDLYSLLTCLIFGGLGYLVFRRHSLGEGNK